MDKDSELELELKTPPTMDEVDFSSGFEKQYKREYRPLPQEVRSIPPPDPSFAWYRNYKAILLVAFLVAVLLVGSLMLTKLVFTSSTGAALGIVAAYILIAVFFIFAEVMSKHLR